MGFSHYFMQQKSVPDEQWALLKQEIDRVFPRVQKVQVRMYRSILPVVICDAEGKKVFTCAQELFQKDGAGDEFIVFNGRAANHLNHETFLLTQRLQSALGFCKTNQKPYDLLVVVVLILADNLCPDCFDISSDGCEAYWEGILNWLNRSLATQYQLPHRLISENSEGTL